ncbi:MAG TPA: hypothetical protein VEK37_02605, partial [Gemmatimonadaceae bacterium]|nr:hypothetical protein [Gemmatimonadaceae bacterium]
MSGLPERPFVPHRTPKTARPVAAQFDFRLSRPFIPGSVATEVTGLGASDAAFVAGLSTTNTDAGSHLPPIEDFLGTREDSSIA